MKEIQQHLDRFNPISLSEMDNVKLLDRMDSKFCFHSSKLPELLNQMIPNYRLLEVCGNKVSRYETPYYDTESFTLYHQHQNGIAKRFKIRHRNYLDSQLSFFEIKLKNNKGRTIKHRVRITENNYGTDSISTNTASENLLQETTPYSATMLCKKLTVRYSRLTFVSNTSCERVTIDLQLAFTYESTSINFSTAVIAEVKQDKASLASPFIKLMRKQKITEGGISKYCLGAASLYPNIKQNLFKEQIKQFKKTAA